MTTTLIGNRLVTIGLMTMLAPFGAVLAGTAPPVATPTPSPAVSVDRCALAPGPLEGSNADVPWLYENLISFPKAPSGPLKPSADAPPAEPTTQAQLALAELQPPGIVQNLRRADRP